MMPGNPVVGSTVLRRPAIQSPNFETGVSGWTVNADGSAEFDNVVIRGTFSGTDFIVTNSGIFFYSGTPALGNLQFSFVPGGSPVTDPEGNTAQPGITVYSSANNFANLNNSVLSFQVQSGQPQPAFIDASPVGELGIASGEIAAGDTQALINLASAQATGSGTEITLSAGATTITGTLQVNGSGDTGAPTNNNTSTNGLTSGVINGTSGGASAGTAHTHGPGSFAVANGQHAHTLNSHAHPL